MPSRALDFLTARRTRLILAWVALLAAAGHRVGAAWVNFRHADRADGNDGHTSIDFGGQWLMGRLLVLGHGRELYSRSRHLEVARASFPHDREPPNATDHDAERLVGWYVGAETDPVGGPLYPPVHAFVMAPIALIPDPYIAYRVTQGLMLGFVGLAGLGIRYLTGGRWWWTVATAFLLLFPGCRGSIALAQNSALTLALLIWGWALVVRGRPGWGGVLWGMLAFKPVWAVSFLVALILLRQWRAAAAMAATGAGLALLTIPVVGVQAWLDWLHVGQLAADAYNVDRNWIFLSRDLFGIPRRMLLEFRDGRAVADRPVAAVAGWALWLAVAGTTVILTRLRLRRDVVSHSALTGPLPAFVFLGAWLCSYRFMYYDALIAPLGVVVLLADPRPYFRRAWWPFTSWAAILTALLLVIENATAPLNVEVSASVMGLRKSITGPDGVTQQTAPTIYLASGDYYPWDTTVVFALWLWCAVRRPVNSDDRSP
jgi:arabinofuranan 3-O-arabinosyltransferase